MFQKQNLFKGSKNVFDLKQKHFFVFGKQNLFPQHMFPARLNWETFASATMLPSLARPLQNAKIRFIEVFMGTHVMFMITIGNEQPDNMKAPQAAAIAWSIVNLTSPPPTHP